MGSVLRDEYTVLVDIENWEGCDIRRWYPYRLDNRLV